MLQLNANSLTSAANPTPSPSHRQGVRISRTPNDGWHQSIRLSLTSDEFKKFSGEALHYFYRAPQDDSLKQSVNQKINSFWANPETSWLPLNPFACLFAIRDLLPNAKEPVSLKQLEIYDSSQTPGRTLGMELEFPAHEYTLIELGLPDSLSPKSGNTPIIINTDDTSPLREVVTNFLQWTKLENTTAAAKAKH